MVSSRQPVIFLSIIAGVLLILGLSLSLSGSVGAQRSDPVPYTPGVPVIQQTPTFPPDACYPPLPLTEGDVIYIEPGVNIRNGPTKSSAIVWNTIYDNRFDPDGDDGEYDFEVVDNPEAVPAVIVDGPVCSQRYNWWRITGTGNPGWVAEGRPDEDGYYIGSPLIDTRGTCDSLYTLAVGMVVNPVLDARIRQAPDRESLTKTVVPAGTPVYITGGPACVDGYLWWAVRATVVNFTYNGWMSEGFNGDYYLIPPNLPSTADGTLCANPLPLVVGSRALVSYNDLTPKALRSAPGKSSPLLFTLVTNVPLIIEGGPVCADNLNWWQVRVLASQEVIGWMAEGSPSVGYWIDEFDAYEFAPGVLEQNKDNDANDPDG